jgi:hypothetical protein
MNNDWEKRFDEAFESDEFVNPITGNYSRARLKDFIRTERKAAYTQALEDCMNLPVFADKHERKYQIGINEAWKQIKALAVEKEKE